MKTDNPEVPRAPGNQRRGLSGALGRLGVLPRLVLPVCLAGLAIVAVTLVTISHLRTRAVEQAGLATGRAAADQVVTLRNFYTMEVVSRATKAGMGVNFDFADKDNVLPLPATLVKALGKQMATEYPGSDLRLLSHYPFHSRPRAKLDEFERSALAALERDPATPVHRIEKLNGRLSARYAVADIMKTGCVACHNSHPLSPKHDWKVGDVRGMVEVIVPIDEMDAGISAGATTISYTAAGGFGLLAFVIWFVAGSLRRDLGGEPSYAAEIAAEVSGGNLTRQIVVSREDNASLLYAMKSMVERLSRLVGQVQKSGIQVGTSAAEITATSNDQRATTSEIAATTSEIGATAKEISATARELVKVMGDVSAVAGQSADLADSGQKGLSRMEDTMRRVMAAAVAFNAKLSKLNEKVGDINQVVTTITRVADQTNLLSLNAAIEAEKAGEYGRGFSVVANEIRRLADQTAVSTLDIEQIVKEIQLAVSAGVMGMDKFSEEVRQGMQDVQMVGEQLSKIIQQVQTLAPRFGAVNEGMQAQSIAAEQISQALSQLSEAASQTVESLRKSSQTIDQLNQVASDLHSGVSRFKLQ